MSAITRLLPKRALSRLVGHFMHWKGPRIWAKASIYGFAKFYKINLDEAEKSYSQYPSIGEFFIRKLKSSARVLGAGWALHPADSVITQNEIITQGQLIQAKGISYNLKDFTADIDADTKWDGGYFLTYYLCPTDYHRVHSPVSGKIMGVRHIAGELWPVNDWSTTNVPDLFTVNERVLVEIQTELGLVGVMFVGATNVGHIVLSFDESIRGNAKTITAPYYKPYSPAIEVQKGDELGMFRMGSTIVMLYPPAFKQQFSGKLKLGPQVQVKASLTP